MQRLNSVSFSSLFFLLLTFVFWQPAISHAQQKERYRNLRDALASAGNLIGSEGPRNVNWIDNGDRYSYMAFNAQTQSMEIRAYDPATGADSLIFNNKNHTFPDSAAAFQYDSFQWSKDSKYIVFESNFRPVYRNSGISDYYYYSLEDDTLKLLVKNARTAELSPDGSKVGFERGGDLYVYDLQTQQEKQLTNSAQEHVYNGRFGWVYEEEFGLVQAWSWSPDSKYIAFWHTDERDVPIFRTTDYSGEHPQYIEIPYPEVGDTNPTVRIGVVNVESSDLKWMDVDLNGGYIPRLYWTAREGTLGILHLNRPQNDLKLFFYDVDTGKGKLIMEESSDTWIDIFDFFASVDDYFFFPKDREEFFWISDRDGWNHIYRYNYDGKLINQVTKGNWSVTDINAINSKKQRIYYTSTEESPLERHLYAINFDGKDKQKLTTVPGTHNISMGSNAKYYIDRYSNTTTPIQVELWKTEGNMIKKLEDNQEVSGFINEHVYAPRQLFHFTTSDGQKLDGYMIKPIDFDSTKSYPLLLNIYGGPGAQGVYNAFETSAWNQYLAQQGYVVVDVNNRGSGGYGSKFEKIVYKQLGKWEAHDFVETARWMAQKPWVDGNRMAIRGHSYGGYMSSLTPLLYPDVFKVSIVTAPVTDWRLYDSIYTERYMGLLQNNKEGYIESSPQTYADSLQANMLLSHSTMDDNVHVQNTMQFLTALINAGKDVDLRIYPPGEHGVAYNVASYLLLYKTYTQYLNEHLK